MNRIEVIKRLIAKRGYRRYLEIGCAADECFSQIQAEVKVGVDPASGGTLRMTSDEFFPMSPVPFDLIFIDGNHHHDQVWRDVCSSLRNLAPGGALVMHDCLPPTAEYESQGFCGTVWRAFAKIRERPDFDAITGDFDFGVGIVHIRPNPAPVGVIPPMASLTYADMIANREDWMRPHTEEQIAALLEA